MQRAYLERTREIYNPNCGQAHVKLCKKGLAIAPLNFVAGDITWLLTGLGCKL